MNDPKQTGVKPYHWIFLIFSLACVASCAASLVVGQKYPSDRLAWWNTVFVWLCVARDHWRFMRRR